MREKIAKIQHVFQEGNKILTVNIFPPTGDAYTYLLKDDAKPKVPGATSSLYEQAAQAIKKASQDTGTEIIYTLYTQRDSMIAWAKTKGEQIFNWDTVYEDTGSYSGSKSFYPEDKTK